jgi:outer membrane lipoprotein-sorting protein
MRPEEGYRGFISARALAGGVSPLLLGLLLFTSSCAVKTTVRVPVSAKVLAAKTATLDELLSSLASYSEKITALSSGTLKVTYTSGKVESGKLQAYRSAPGYILLRRPDSLRLNIQYPVTKMSLAQLTSVGDPFLLWVTSKNEYFVGKNSMKEIEVQGYPDFRAKPAHILEAILPHKVDLNEPGSYLAMEEERDGSTKYYVLSLLKGDGGQILHPRRKLWIDRSVLAITRQETYDVAGRIVSDITYSQLTPVGELLLPLSVKIDRPLDDYSLDMQFKDWRVNPDLPPNSFEFTPPEGAQRVELKEKGRSE